MDIVRSVNGVPIRLTDERWGHIEGQRRWQDDLSAKDEVLSTIGDPDSIHANRDGSMMGVRMLDARHAMIVSFREIEASDGFIITAWRTNKVHKITHRPTIWTKPS